MIWLLIWLLLSVIVTQAVCLVGTTGRLRRAHAELALWRISPDWAKAQVRR